MSKSKSRVASKSGSTKPVITVVPNTISKPKSISLIPTSNIIKELISQREKLLENAEMLQKAINFLKES